MNELMVQKQPFPDVLPNSCSSKFRKFHRKTPVLESLFTKVADLKACNVIRDTPTNVFSREIREIFRNTIFYRTPAMAAFEW